MKTKCWFKEEGTKANKNKRENYLIKINNLLLIIQSYIYFFFLFVLFKLV